MDGGEAGLRILQPLPKKLERGAALKGIGDRERVGDERLGLRIW
jgi:hypothetical protein